MDESIRKIVEELEQPGPRYTSYPTAPVWKNEFPVSQFKSGLENQIRESTPLSFYIHLPFCEKLCHFCACNKVIDSNRKQSDSYLDALRTEVSLVSNTLRARGVIEQLHWGGGTPTFFSAKELENLFRFLEKRFRWSSDPEISIEANPVVTKKEHLHALARLGFNRLSMGVQDFDARVQDAINRHQTFEQTKILVEEARHFEFKSCT
jgi:oxygen-independent coproporphyrinogen-3 oxidase